MKKGWWKFYAVIAWFGAEFLGAVVGILILRTEDVLPVLPFAWAFAIGSYFVLKAYLSRKPDFVDPAFEFEGQHQHPQ